jgi:hypothetical protein
LLGLADAKLVGIKARQREVEIEVAVIESLLVAFIE